MSNIQTFDLSANLLESILWQYNDAEHLQSIINDKQNWYNTNITEFLNDWYTNVFNVDTANEFGLDIWARILDINFDIPQPVRTDFLAFGFGQYKKVFGNGNFLPKKDNIYYLSLEQKRLVVKLTYQKYHTFPSIPEINKILQALIDPKAYMVDNLNMSQSVVVFERQLTDELQFIIDRYDLIPRPAGLGIDNITVTGRAFGFGSNRNNWNKTSFLHYS